MDLEMIRGCLRKGLLPKFVKLCQRFGNKFLETIWGCLRKGLLPKFVKFARDLENEDLETIRGCLRKGILPKFVRFARDLKNILAKYPPLSLVCFGLKSHSCVCN